MALIDKLIAPPGNTAVSQKPGFSPRTRRVLEGAYAEAESMRFEEVGTEHILLAMLKETDCVGTRLLYTMGANIQKLYAAVLTAMGMDRIILIAHLENKASIRVAEKSGFHA